jgi:hypothetical protein
MVTTVAETPPEVQRIARPETGNFSRLAPLRLGPYRHPSDAMTETTIREARLRADYANDYPGIEPGVWFTAATLAEHLELRRLRDQERALPDGPRRLSGDHFEFRGGERPIGVRAVLGRRTGD